MHQYQDLTIIFKNCFFEKYNTLLVKGIDEPLYLPADENRPHNELFFAHGFFASALHECSHWLIAGEKRRKQVDFGYWYVPDGRTAEQQDLFQIVEVKPQAVEWILSQSHREVAFELVLTISRGKKQIQMHLNKRYTNKLKLIVNKVFQ